MVDDIKKFKTWHTLLALQGDDPDAELSKLEQRRADAEKEERRIGAVMRLRLPFVMAEKTNKEVQEDQQQELLRHTTAQYKAIMQERSEGIQDAEEAIFTAADEGKANDIAAALNYYVEWMTKVDLEARSKTRTHVCAQTHNRTSHIGVSSMTY